MLTSTEKNVELTFEQLQQITVVEGRLKNLEAEIAIATKNLGVLQKEVIKATKEREYQEELSAKLTIEIEEKKVQKSSLESSVAQLSAAVEESKAENARIDRESAAKESEIQRRSEALKESEETHTRGREAFGEEVVAQKTDREAIDKALEAFRKAALTVTWK